jgi:diadenosine tetraphosphate (Ap4A) HIT family hydrolase
VTEHFVLDARLAADTLAVAELEQCSLRLMNDARFAWAVLVPRIAGATELALLPAATRRAIEDEVAAIAKKLLAWPGTTKVNTGMLGNIVRQLHVHLVARHEGDAAWPGPVWGHGTRVAWRPGEEAELVAWLKG